MEQENLLALCHLPDAQSVQFCPTGDWLWAGGEKGGAVLDSDLDPCWSSPAGAWGGWLPHGLLALEWPQEATRLYHPEDGREAAPPVPGRLLCATSERLVYSCGRECFSRALEDGSTLSLGEFAEISVGRALVRVAGRDLDGVTVVKDICRGEELWRHRFRGQEQILSLSPDGSFLAIGDDLLVRVHPSEGGQPVAEFPQGKKLERLEWSQDGETLLILAGSSLSWIRRCDWAVLGQYECAALVSSMDFQCSADSTRLVVMSVSGRKDDAFTTATLLFREPNGMVVGHICHHDANGVTAQVSPDGKLLGVSSRHGGEAKQSVTLVHASGRVLGRLPVYHRGWLYHPNFVFDLRSERMAIADDRGVVIWCLRAMREKEPAMPVFKSTRVQAIHERG